MHHSGDHLPSCTGCQLLVKGPPTFVLPPAWGRQVKQMSMLNHISWQQYLTALLLLTTAWYAYIGYLYYQTKISAALKIRPGAKSSLPAVANCLAGEGSHPSVWQIPLHRSNRQDWGFFSKKPQTGCCWRRCEFKYLIIRIFSDSPEYKVYSEGVFCSHFAEF